MGSGKPLVRDLDEMPMVQPIPSLCTGSCLVSSSSFFLGPSFPLPSFAAPAAPQGVVVSGVFRTYTDIQSNSQATHHSPRSRHAPRVPAMGNLAEAASTSNITPTLGIAQHEFHWRCLGAGCDPAAAVEGLCRTATETERGLGYGASSGTLHE